MSVSVSISVLDGRSGLDIIPYHVSHPFALVDGKMDVGVLCLPSGEFDGDTIWRDLGHRLLILMIRDDEDDSVDQMVRGVCVAY